MLSSISVLHAWPFLPFFLFRSSDKKIYFFFEILPLPSESAPTAANYVDRIADKYMIMIGKRLCDNTLTDQFVPSLSV